MGYKTNKDNYCVFQKTEERKQLLWKFDSRNFLRASAEISNDNLFKKLISLMQIFVSEIGMNIEVLTTEMSGGPLRDHRVAATLLPLFVTPLVVLILFFVASVYFGYSYR